jgi:hypothetical protein
VADSRNAVARPMIPPPMMRILGFNVCCIGVMSKALLEMKNLSVILGQYRFVANVLPDYPYYKSYASWNDAVLAFRLLRQVTIHHAKATVSQYPLAFTGVNDYDVTVKIYYIWG